MKRVLIISAHPDDDIIGCGGMIAKYSETDTIFKVIFIAEGSTCRYEFPDSESAKKEVKKRNKYAINALKKLGVNNLEFYNLPCGRLDQHPLIEINKIIEKEINNFNPDTVFTHSENDTNNDHSIVAKSTRIATRPLKNRFVESVYSYEILSSSEWKYTKNFLPNYFEQLEKEHILKKWEALNEYKSEIKSYPFPRSEEGIITLAKYRGMQSGLNYAESFKLIRKINL